MPQISDQLLNHSLQQKIESQGAAKLQVSEAQTKQLMEAALPQLIKGLAENTQEPGAGQKLWTALKNPKHDGKILDSNEDFFEDANLEEGDKIIKHILGDTRNDIAAALALDANTDISAAKKTLAALSPLVMGAFGKAVQSKKLNADEIGKILQHALKEKDFAKAGHRIGLMLLDKNNNGQYKDDLFEMGRKWLSGLLSKSKK